MNGALGLSANLRRRVVKPANKSVRTIRTPFGRAAFTRDPGSGGLLDGSAVLLSTNLRAAHRDADGRLVREYNFGSGLVTNVGALQLAQEGLLTIGPSAAPASLFPNLKWQGWGTGTTAEAATDIKLQTPGAPTATECVEATNTLSANGEGKPKLVSTRKIKAESSLAITEWGIFTAKKLSATTGEPLVSQTATEGKTTGTALTASSTTVKGETLQILLATEAEEIWGLITSNTTSVVTVPAWYKQSSGAVKAPSGTSKYTLRPVMFDHRVFSAINVVSGNEVEFIYELEVKSGG